MGMARTSININDRTSRSTPPSGIAAAIVIPALKGAVNQAFQCEDEGDLLDFYTPDGTVTVGMDLSFFEADAYLSKGPIWVSRAANGALFGGLIAPKAGSGVAAYTLPYPWADPTTDDFGAGATTWVALHVYPAAAEVVPTAANGYYYYTIAGGTASGSQPTWPTVVGQTVTDGTVTWICAGSYTGGTGIAAWQGTHAYVLGNGVVPTVANGYYYVCSTAGTTSGSQPTWPTTIGQTVADGTVTWTCAGTNSTSDWDALLLYQCNPGAWGNNISITIQNYLSSPTVVKEPGAFIINVFKLGTQVETWLCSLNPQQKDGYGNPIYVQQVLLASKYIRALVNPALAYPAVAWPVEITTALAFSQGSDGAAVTDTQMIAALQAFANPAMVQTRLILDGGWTTPAFQQAIDALCVSRQDCRAPMNTRLVDESTTTYLTDLGTYRTSTLNLNSYYSSLNGPHVLIQDKWNSRQIYVPLAGYKAAGIAVQAAKGRIFEPAAGMDPDLALNVIDLKRRFSEVPGGEMDILVNEQINPARFVPNGGGIVMWGNSTLLTRPSILQDENASLLIAELYPLLLGGFNQFLFKLDQPGLFKQITDQVNAILHPYVIGGAFSQPPIVECDTQNNSNTDIANGQVNVAIGLAITPYTKRINVTLTLLNPGATLSIAA